MQTYLYKGKQTIGNYKIILKKVSLEKFEETVFSLLQLNKVTYSKK